jgi:phosphoribosyl 1,2-cyclic phosphodiesterase
MAKTTDTARVLFLGTGGALPSPMYYCPTWPTCEICASPDSRDTRAETGILLEFKGRRTLIDAGRGVAGRFAELAWRKGPMAGIGHEENPWNAPPVDRMLLTHAHFDHWGSLEDFSKIYFRDWQKRSEEARPFEVFTHEATRRALAAAGPALGKYGRPPRVQFSDCMPGTSNRVDDDLELASYEVQHSNLDGCLAFLVTLRVDSGTRRILMVGDADPMTDDRGVMTSWAERIVADSRGADLVIVSAKSGWNDRRRGQMSVHDILRVFAPAQPKRLALLHFSHAMGMNHAQMSAELGPTRSALGLPSTMEVILAYDGLSLSL